jgi:hypothetical protein
MGRPSALYENSYPGNVPSTWPMGEAYFPSRWVWAHSEFTPRQTMRGKMALYGYLYGLAAAPPPANPTLTVANTSVAGGSGVITSVPGGIDCGIDCDQEYANGTAVTLTATPDVGSDFAGWAGACYGSDATCEVTMAVNRSVTATFEPEGLTYLLTVSRNGSGDGTVTSLPGGINCGVDCSESYLSGASVELSALPDGGSTFIGWSGACSGTGVCTVTMNAARSVTATFQSNNLPDVMIYDDALADGWEDWSWGGTIDLAGTAPVQIGAHAVNATLNGWGGFSPNRPSGAIDTTGYDAVKFWVHGGTGANKAFVFFSEGAGGSSPSIAFTAVANAWTEITMTLADLGNPTSISRLNFQNNSASTIGMVTFDQIRLAPAAAPGLFQDGFESADTSAWSTTSP